MIERPCAVPERVSDNVRSGSRCSLWKPAGDLGGGVAGEKADVGRQHASGSLVFPRAKPGREELEFTIRQRTAGVRLDKWLTMRFEGFSRNFFQQMIRDGLVFLNERPARPGHRVRAGETIVIRLRENLGRKPEELPLDIIYRDDMLICINKQPGVVVHPARGHLTGTLINGILHLYRDRIEDPDFHIGLAHRLDIDTSGAVLVVTDAHAHTLIQKQFERRVVRKTYLCIVHGEVPESRFVVDAPLGVDPEDRKRVAVDGVGAKSARTDFELLGASTGISLLRAKPHTGRSHQIRVHAAHAGHPIVADVTYGGRTHNEKGEELIARCALHSESLTFWHPGKHDWIALTAELPDDMTGLLERSGIRPPPEVELDPKPDVPDWLLREAQQDE